MGLEEVLKRIEEEGERRLKSHEAEFRKQKEEIERSYGQEYNRLTRELKAEQSHRQAIAKQRALARFRTELRVRLLDERRKVMAEVFAAARESILKLPDKEYAEFFIRRIKGLDIDGGRVIIGRGDEKRLKRRLKGALSKFEISFSDSFEHGVIVESGKIRFDLTLDAVFRELTETLEEKVAEVLFG